MIEFDNDYDLIRKPRFLTTLSSKILPFLSSLKL
ncbi:hypothetical protein THOM_0331 [Trachipleistophora hominis]|uniref:Uncharacterized protein n=1 Tax=Trachipleistophora hominis TaxID=72359 RepID=L7JZ63_TRAHO|nr:hypothetical protein THOM_0331 [Trachipleistophora hominis]